MANFFSLYLDNHSDFDLVHAITEDKINIKIYKRRTIRSRVHALAGAGVRFEKDIYQLYVNAFERNRLAFDYLNGEMQKILNWDDEQIQFFSRIIRNREKETFWRAYDFVKNNHTY